MEKTFDHEKLDVYRLQLEFVAWSSRLLDGLVSGGPALRDVRDHLSRAGLSVLLNLAEGNGKRQRRTRAKFFDDARGSATECAACLDALVALGVCTEQDVQSGKEMLLRVVAMLTRLVVMFSETKVREEGAEYVTHGHGDGWNGDGTTDDRLTAEHEDEDEDEDEHDCGASHPPTHKEP